MNEKTKDKIKKEDKKNNKNKNSKSALNEETLSMLSGGCSINKFRR